MGPARHTWMMNGKKAFTAMYLIRPNKSRGMPMQCHLWPVTDITSTGHQALTSLKFKLKFQRDGNLVIMTYFSSQTTLIRVRQSMSPQTTVEPIKSRFMMERLILMTTIKVTNLVTTHSMTTTIRLSGSLSSMVKIQLGITYWFKGYVVSKVHVQLFHLMTKTA